MEPRPVDRRSHTRDALFLGRRRYPRLRLTADAFYESEQANVLATEVDVGMRGLFLPCRFPDREGARGVVRVDVGSGALVKAEVEVLRALDGERRPGMALRIVSMAEADRLRFAAFLLRRGGLAMLPQLERDYRTLTLAPRAPGASRAA